MEIQVFKITHGFYSGEFFDWWSEFFAWEGVRVSVFKNQPNKNQKTTPKPNKTSDRKKKSDISE